MSDKSKKKDNDVSRRDFLKLGGTIAVGLQVGAVAGAGLALGKDPSTHTGWQHLGDNTQFVNRKPLEIEGLAYEITGPTRRPEKAESVFGRNDLISVDMKSIRASKSRSTSESSAGDSQEIQQSSYPPMEAFTGALGAYYDKYPNVYELDKIRTTTIIPNKHKNTKKYGDYYTLINAWSDAWQTSEGITTPPEVSDFRLGNGRPIPKAVPFKSPEKASKLIKKVTHHFGASMVGITKLNPDWCYNYGLRGSNDTGSYKVPDHWEYVIAFGVPHQWEQVESNPNMGTSFDAYSRVTIAARRLENFIKSLGYAARRHSPMDGYDLIAVPILVESGLGQQGRHGIVVTPESGSNFRAAFVTTNLPMDIDLPIDFGVNEFCNHCKICAELCPSESISLEENNDKMNYRGYNHWEINQTSCFNYWVQSMGGMGCRLCLIACPYSRKANWGHKLARKLDTNDPTGLVNNGLTWFQKTFFETPAAGEYLPPPDGRFANYREPPEWLKVKDYLNIDYIDPTNGE